MDHISFHDWKDKSVQKLQNENFTLLKNIVSIKVEIEQFKLQFKSKQTIIDCEELNFL